MRKNTIGYIVAFMFIIGGAIFIWTGVYTALDSYRFMHTSISTQGTVTDVTSYIRKTGPSDGTSGGKFSTYYSSIINFETDDGKIIDFTPTPTTAYRYVGEKLDILYNPKNPNEARIKTPLWGFLLDGVFPIIGIFVMSVGLLVFLAPIFKRRRSKWLHQYGTTITVPILRVEKEVTKRGDIYGFKIVSQWQNPQDQKIYTFEDNTFNYDPTSYVEGKQISILIDPKNPKRYEMDLSTLPKEA